MTHEAGLVEDFVLDECGETVLEWRDVLNPADPISQVVLVLEETRKESEGKKYHSTQ